MYATKNFNKVTTKTIKINKKTTHDSLIEDVFLNCNQQILDNYFSLLKHYDTENLHQMRIGLRRLKSFLRFFKNEISRNEWEIINKIIKQLIKPTSKARDFDVVKTDYIYPAFHDNENVKEFENLHDHSEHELMNLHTAILNELSSRHYQNIVKDLQIWVENKKWVQTPSTDNILRNNVLRKLIEKKIQRRYKKIMRSKKHVLAFTQKELHGLRVNVKELRYILDVLGFCIKHKNSELKLLKNLQDILGKINDTYVAERVIQEINTSSDNSVTRLYFERQTYVRRNQYLHELKDLA